MPFRATALALLWVLVAPAAASAAPRGLDIGFLDYLFSQSNAGERIARLDEARSSGAGTVRIHLDWATTARSAPAHPADPADPAYDWRFVDAGVQAATARGLRVVISMHDTPRWAEGTDRPRNAPPGTWKPNPGRSATSQAAAAALPGVQVLADLERAEPRASPRAAVDAPRRSIGSRPPLSTTGACSTPPTRRSRRVNPDATWSWARARAPYGDPPGAIAHAARDVLEGRPQAAHELRHLRAPPLLGRRDRGGTRSNSQRHLGPGRREADAPRAAAVRRGHGGAAQVRSRLWITEIGVGLESARSERRAGRAATPPGWPTRSMSSGSSGAAKIVWTFVRDQAPTRRLSTSPTSPASSSVGRSRSSRSRRSPSPSPASARGAASCASGARRPRQGPSRSSAARGRFAASRPVRKRVFLTTVTGRSSVQVKAGNQTSLKCAL